MTFSATRITSWFSCNRRAAWKYVAGYEEPDTPDTLLGKQVHQALEAFGRNPALLPDLLDPVQAIAAEALPYVRSVVIPGVTEFEGEIAVQGRHRWTGQRDLHPQLGVVWDYKTSGDFKWAKTPEELQWDPQAILYAEHEFRRYPELTHVHLTWLYLRKRKPYAPLPVNAIVERAHTARCFEALEQLADQMQAAAWQSPLDPIARHKYILATVQPNFGHCDAYRGCPHRRHCPDAPFIHFGAKDPMSNNTMTLEDIVKAGQAGQAPPAPQAPTANGTHPAFQPGGTFAGATPPSGAPPAPSGNPHPAAGSTVVFDASWSQTAPAEVPAPTAVPPVLINPPSTRGRGRPKGSTNKPKDTGVASKTIVTTVDIGGASTHVFNDGTTMTVAAYDAAKALAAELEARGQAELEAQTRAALAAAAPSVLVTTPMVVPTVASVAPTSPAAMETTIAPNPVTAPTPPIGTLYIACAPRGAAFVVPADFDALALEIKRDLITFPVWYTNYGYKANGMLTQAMQQVIEHRRPAAVVVSDPRTPEAAVCLSYLRSVAATIVEGRW